jgi:hypothetical protein
MSSTHSQRPLLNGNRGDSAKVVAEIEKENARLVKVAASDNACNAIFHGDNLIGVSLSIVAPQLQQSTCSHASQDKRRPEGFVANVRNTVHDIRSILTLRNIPKLTQVLAKLVSGGGLDVRAPTSRFRGVY